MDRVVVIEGSNGDVGSWRKHLQWHVGICIAGVGQMIHACLVLLQVHKDI